MINANNLLTILAQMKFFLWESTFNGKWVVFEAMPEDEDAGKGKAKRSTSFEDKGDAEEYLKKKRAKFIKKLQETIEVKAR